MNFQNVVSCSFITICLSVVSASAVCNSASDETPCAVNSDCPGSGIKVSSVWFYPSGVPFCEPTTCKLHTPTIGHPYEWTYSGTCSVTGCQGSKVVDFSIWTPSGDCVQTSGTCTTGTCTGFTGWSNHGCAADGCGAGQMSQWRDGNSPGCCDPITQKQCVTDTVNCPVVPSCGPGHICGNIHAAEKTTLALPGMALELRNDQGNVIRTVLTAADGTYDFSPMPLGNYTVVAIGDRLWNPSPGFATVTTDNPLGSGDFTMRFVPAKVVPTGIEGTFVLFTTYTYVDTTPPPVGGSHWTMGSISMTIERFTPPLSAKLYGGLAWSMKCWHPEIMGQAKVEWVVGPSVAVNGGAPVWPLDELTEACL